MKKAVLLHAELSHLIATMGHGDILIVGDAGLPIPAQVPRIDLAVSAGIPSIAQVLHAIESEWQVERIVLAKETLERSGGTLPAWLPAAWQAPQLQAQITHEAFKQLCAQARAVVRTGECTPYANVALVAGVTF